MTMRGDPGVQVIPPHSRSRSADRGKRWLRALGIMVVIVGALLFWVRQRQELGRQVSRLPAEERAALYQRELKNFRALCGSTPKSGALAAQCRERAEFLLEFPECDAGCQELARVHLTAATR